MGTAVGSGAALEQSQAAASDEQKRSKGFFLLNTLQETDLLFQLESPPNSDDFSPRRGLSC